MADSSDPLGHAGSAFVRRLSRQLRGDRDPPYAIVVLDSEGDDYRYESLTHGTRSDLVYAAAVILQSAVDMGAEDPCVCAHCDERTAAARGALAALGFAQIRKAH